MPSETKKEETNEQSRGKIFAGQRGDIIARFHIPATAEA